MIERQFSLNDIIVAPATPQGISALAVIRITGEGSVGLFSRCFSKQKINEAKGGTAHFGKVLSAESQVLDEVIAVVFRAPNSFTGQETVEISCHGNPIVVEAILKRLIDLGARPAEPGEFTKRAFLLGKMNLSEAEAIGDLIHAESEVARKTATSQLRGGYSRELQDLREKLIEVSALLELELDFGEEDVEFAQRATLKDLCESGASLCRNLASGFKLGKAIKEGIPVAIIGKPNAGKSTLLNALLNEDKAIVSPIAGTTRDYIEDTLSIKGINFRIIDTAGIRKATDSIEKEGVERSLKKAAEASIIIHLIDLSDKENDTTTLPDNIPVLKVYNKADLAKGSHSSNGGLTISAAKNEGIENLKEALFSLATGNKEIQPGSLVTNMRHYEALTQAAASLEAASGKLTAGLTSDLVAMDLRNGLHHLGLITGEVYNDELLGFIFGRFCIGK